MNTDKTDTNADLAVQSWKKQLLELCEKGGVSMAEVSQMPNAEGEDSLWSNERENVVIWHGLKKNLTTAICELIVAHQIEMRSTTALIYFMDGRCLQLPLAKKGKRGYKTAHWLPVALNLPNDHR